eukprot:Nk52_evm59s62 gene=Nk52_evmTU59s62
MKVVALISGGKDSCYNMMQCVAVGHEIVALANLHPAGNEDELDSYMYQTVGHECIGMYAQAMDLPLYRRGIQGSSKITTMTYEENKQDEVEDLYELLKTVLEKHPEVKGVSVGAILSDYQRVRVENVCGRLGLTSLGYLWRREQKELLHEMVSFGVHAILVKVAAIGLSPSKHLGKSLGEMEAHLLAMNSKYDLHPCGEGGEYETLVLDCPLFKKKLVVEESEIVIHSDDAFAPVGYLRAKRVGVIEKNSPEEDMDLMARVRESVGVRQQCYISDDLLGECCSLIAGGNKRKVVCSLGKSVDGYQIQRAKNAAFATNGSDLCVAGIRAPLSVAQSDSLEVEVESVLEQMSRTLRENGMGWENVVNVHVYVADMGNFGAVNAVYGRYFKTNPPSRVCVEVHLPEPFRVQMDCVAALQEKKNTGRFCMHVQGVSHWAPANIGPYSQAVSCDEVYFLAGVIGLEPSTMTSPCRVTVVCREIEEKEKAGLFLAEGIKSLASVRNVVKALITCSDDVGECNEELKEHSLGGVCYTTDSSYLDACTKLWNENDNNTPQLLYVSVPNLPRNSVVEWQLIVCGSPSKTKQIAERVAESFLMNQSVQCCTIANSHCTFHTSNAVIRALESPVGHFPMSCENAEAVRTCFKLFLKAFLPVNGVDTVSVRIFYKSEPDSILCIEDSLQAIFYSAIANDNVPFAVTMVPCNEILNGGIIGISAWAKNVCNDVNEKD